MAIVVKRSKGAAKWTDVDLAEPAGAIETAIAAQMEPLGLATVDSESDSSSAEADETPQPEIESDAGDGAGISEQPSITFSARCFEAADTVTALAEAIASMKIELLIIPKSVESRQDVNATDWHDKLYRVAPCRTMYLHDDLVRETEKLKILSVVTEDQDDRATLLTGWRLAEATEGELTAVSYTHLTLPTILLV